MKHLRFFALALLLISGRIYGQEEGGDSTVTPTDSVALELPDYIEADELDMGNPRATVIHQLIWLQPESYNPDSSAAALFPGDYSPSELRDLTIKIKQIFDAKGDYIDTEIIPSDAAYKDSVSGRQRYVISANYPKIYVEKYGDRWLYSKETLRRVPDIHGDIFLFGSDFLVRLSPKVANKTVLGLKVWQWEGILLILIISWLLHFVLNRVFGFLIQRVMPKSMISKIVGHDLVSPVVKPLSYLLVLFVAKEFFLPSLLLPATLGRYVVLTLNVAMPVLGVLVVYRLVDVLTSLMLFLAGKTESSMDDELIPLLSKTAKVVVVVLGLIFVLQNMNINVTALLAGISIGGLALALAAQDTVKNFIGSISILIDQPFETGDFIETGSISGVVLEVGVRSTRIRALSGAIISIPNGDLVNRTIINSSAREYRRYATSLTVTYSTSPQTMEQFVDSVRQILVDHPLTRDESCTVEFHEMADSSLNIYFAAIFEEKDFGPWLKARQEVLLAVMKKAEELGVEFAFPSTSLYVESMPGGSSTPKPES